jgi:hypothetical protein
LLQAAGIPVLDAEHGAVLDRISKAHRFLLEYADEAATAVDARSFMRMLACKMFLPWSRVMTEVEQAGKQLEGIIQ